MKAFRGAWRKAFLAFFLSHIPITILIDAQAVFSPWYPKVLRDLVAWYCHLFGDVLMEYPSPGWFRAIVAGEVFLQLPFFGVAAKMIWKTPSGSLYPSWFRTASLVYGAHTCTTMIPILATFWGAADESAKVMTTSQVVATTAIYLPYLVFPFALICFAAAEESPHSTKLQKTN